MYFWKKSQNFLEFINFGNKSNQSRHAILKCLKKLQKKGHESGVFFQKVHFH